MILFGCSGTKFIYVTANRLKKYGKLTPFKIDNEYDLYTRQVIKVFDPTKKLYVPINAKPDTNNPLIEIEYLLVSRSTKKVLIINNISDKRKSFYNSKDKIADLGAAADTVKIDIWYFSQFRFGKIENNSLIFKNVHGKLIHHIWNINDSGHVIKINSLSVADSSGEDLRIIEKAFAIEMLFFKEDKFQFVFKNNRGKGMKGLVPEFNLANQSIYIVNKTKEIVFRFDTIVSGHFKNVLFLRNECMLLPFYNIY